MTYSPITLTEGHPITEIWDLLLNDRALYRSVSSLLNSEDFVPNGSFETDTDSDGEPDNWIVRALDGGAFGVTETETGHGGRAFWARTPGGSGRGGARIETSSFLPATENCLYCLRWVMKSVPSSVVFRAWVTYYSASKSIIKTDVIYESTENPTDWETRGGQYRTPVETRWVRLFFDLGHVKSDGVSGYQYLDNVEFFTPRYLGNMLKYETAGTYEFVVPAGVVGVRVFAIGAGGAGGAGNVLPPTTEILKRSGFVYQYWDRINLHYGSGGGGGGAFVFGTIPVVPGETITVVVGAGGTGVAAYHGNEGGDTLFGDYIRAIGGWGGASNQTNISPGYGNGGVGGPFAPIHGGALMGIAGTAGQAGYRYDLKNTQPTVLSEYIYLPQGGVGGVSGWRTMYPSVGGTAGSFTQSGAYGLFRGFVHQIAEIPARIVAPGAGTGYGSGGGGGSIGSIGGAGTGGVLIVQW